MKKKIVIWVIAVIVFIVVAPFAFGFTYGMIRGLFFPQLPNLDIILKPYYQ